MRVGVPNDVVEAAERKALRRLAGKARLKGFRKGRAPEAVVKSRFGEAARDEAREAVAEQAFAVTVAEHDLMPITNARAREFEEGDEALTFVLEFDLKPEVTVGRSGGFVVERAVPQVTDENVDKYMDRLQAKLEEAEDTSEGLELHASMGFADVEQFRNSVRAEMEREAERFASEQVQRALERAFVDANPVDPPRSVVVRILRQMLARIVPESEEKAAELIETLRPAAEFEARRGLLFDALVDTEGLDADELEVRSIVNDTADAEGRDRAEAFEAARNAGGLEYLRNQLRERNVLEHIRERSEIIEKRPDSGLIS